MSAFPEAPVLPDEFLTGWLPDAFARRGLPPGSEALDVRLGVQLEGTEGGEWVVRMAGGEITIAAGPREETAFTFVQSVDDWRGALWEGRGSAIGSAAARFFRPGEDPAPGLAPGIGAAPTPAALVELAKLDGLIRLVVAGGEGGDWAVGFRLGPGPVPEEPTCTVTIQADDADALARGELDAMQAFMGGQLAVTGDMTLMLQMQAIQMQIAQQQGGASGGAT